MSYIGFTGTYPICDELINNLEITSNILNTSIINTSNTLQNNIINTSNDLQNEINTKQDIITLNPLLVVGTNENGKIKTATTTIAELEGYGEAISANGTAITTLANQINTIPMPTLVGVPVYNVLTGINGVVTACVAETVANTATAVALGLAVATKMNNSAVASHLGAPFTSPVYMDGAGILQVDLNNDELTFKTSTGKIGFKDNAINNIVESYGYNNSNTVRGIILGYNYASSNDIRNLGYSTSNDIRNLGYATSNDIRNLGYITSNNIRNLGYATSNDIRNLGYASSNDIRSLGYATSNDIRNLGYSTSNDIRNLGYATSNDIRNLGYATSNDIRNLGYATSNNIRSLGYATSNDIRNLGYATSNDIINLGYNNSNTTRGIITGYNYITNNLTGTFTASTGINIPTGQTYKINNTALTLTDLSGSLPTAKLPAFTGDATTIAGASALTLATVNTNVGTFGSATLTPVITVDGKGRITGVSTSTVAGGTSQWTSGTGLIFYNGGNVGIGITNPSTGLDVVNGNTFMATFRHTNLTAGIGIGYDTISAIGTNATNIYLLNLNQQVLLF